MKLVAYIRGGLGDIYPAISAIQPIIEKNNISKYDITIITDSVYYFRDNYPKELEKMSLDMLHKISSNVIMVPPHINQNFNLAVNDVTEEFSQENADKNMNEFMFWRPESLKAFINNIIYRTGTCIFIDAFFTECIMQWNWNERKYERVGDERKKFKSNPILLEKKIIDYHLHNNHLLIHVRKKIEGDSHTCTEEYYNSIIKFCNEKGIDAIVIGIDIYKLKGAFIDLRGLSPYSFEGMEYLINNCKVMLGNDSGFSAIKLYQQQKDKLLIMEHPRWERSDWYFRAIKDNSLCALLDARDNNISLIKTMIEEHYGQ